ncbi:MAG: FAD-dependent oxidoreductase [Acidimicrobiales bacterium]
MAPEQLRGPRRFDRSTMLAELADRTFDVVVVGGGLTGAGVALDAASRGLRTALVERDDFSSGSSAHSAKLLHGGLRHLPDGDRRLITTAFGERRRLLANAAHLIEPLAFVMPSRGVDLGFARTVDRMLWAYGLLEGRREHGHRHIDAAEAAALLPVLRDLDGGFLVDNAVIDDARLVLALVRTACLDHAATVVNHAEVVGVEHGASGRVAGVRVLADGDEFTVATRAVVNAGGVTTGEIARLDGSVPTTHQETDRVTHVAVSASCLPFEAATVLPGLPAVAVVPWGDVVLLGPVAVPADRVPPERAGVEAILERVRETTTVSPGTDDIRSVTSALRPRRRARRATPVRSATGMVTVSAATLTTYRMVAADTVDAVVHQFADDLDRWVVRRCRTADLPLRGTAGHDDVMTDPALGAAISGRLVRRHGGEAGAVMAMAAADGGERLTDRAPILTAEVRYAARYEMARTVADVLDRRTRLRMTDQGAAEAAADRVAIVLGEELGWDAPRVQAAADDYRTVRL